jgi:thiol-disulfide isomerase/thioredoxin
VFALALAAALAAPAAPGSEVAKQGAEVGKWTMDLDAATKLAKEKQLPMLLNFTGSDWCGWCKLMDESVYAKKEWQDYAATKLVLVTVDFPQGENIVPKEFVARNGRLQEQFKIQGYPTYVLVESDGSTEIERLGAGQDKTPKSFITEIENALALAPSNIEKRAAALGTEKGAEFKAAVAKLNGLKEEFKAWLETGPQQTEENDKTYQGFQTRLEAAHKAVTSF